MSSNEIDKHSYPSSKLQYYLLNLSRGTERIEKLGTEIVIPEGVELGVPDKIPQYCYVVKEGRVLCFDLMPNGENRIFNVFEAGSMIMEECLLLNMPCKVTFKTMVPCRLVQLKKCDIKRAFKHDIDIVMDMYEYVALKFLSKMELERLGCSYNADWKICVLLQIYSVNYGIPYDGKILINENITQQMIAETVGVSRYTVSKLFKNLKRENILEWINGKYCIRSAERLQEYIDSFN